MSLTPEILVNKSLQLVSPPETYSKLSSLIDDPDSAIDDIAAVINTDPALATRLLKIVNSPFYGFPSQINTISRAITIIGTRELTNLVLATSVVNAFKGIPSSLIDMDLFWHHSFASALTCRLLAELHQERNKERFFIAGLIHNIGSLVLYLSVPELIREAVTTAKYNNQVLFEAEKQVIGFDHTEVGACLTKAWGLPEFIQQTTRYHHSPSQAENFQLDVSIVHIADILVSSVPFGHSGDDHIPPLDNAAWDRLNIDHTQIPDLMQEVAEQLTPVGELMLS